MLPFKIFDRDQKTTWVILNYHPDADGGSYLGARDDDSDQDGEIVLLTLEQVMKCKMVGFVEDPE